MKKLAFVTMLALQITLLFAQAPTITKIDEKGIKLGNKYFYAFDGAKWEWTLDLLGSKSAFGWAVGDAYKITDAKNGLTNKIALYAQCKQLGTNWYFIEHDGFLCKYEKNDSSYTITKFLPLNPTIGTKWIADSRQNAVTSVTDDFVKIEVEGDKKATSGYKLFRKDVGLYDLFEIEKNKNGQVTTKWTLTKYIPPALDTPPTTTTSTTSTTTTTVAQTAAITPKAEPEQTPPETASVTSGKSEQTAAETQPAVTEQSTATEVPTAAATTAAPSEPAVYISNLPVKTDFIQVGAFSQQPYAEQLYNKCKAAGYDCVIYTENNSYKVLIRPGDIAEPLKKIKADLNIDGFYKQRK